MYQLRFILLCCFLMCAFTASAQWEKEKVRVSLGENLSRSHHKGTQQMVGSDGNNIFTLQKKMTPFYHFGNKQLYTYLLQQYNADMELVNAKKLPLQREGKSLTYEFMVHLNEAIYLFTSGHDAEEEKKKLFFQKINTQSLEAEGPHIQVAEVGKEDLGGHFSWKLSEDKSKLLLLYTYDIEDRHTYDLYVFDRDLTELWSKKNALPAGSMPFAIEQYEIDEKGNVYLLSTLFRKQRREKRAGAPDYAYRLTAYKQQGTIEERFGINLPGKFLTDIRIKVNDEQDVVGGGFYAAKGSYSLKGSYFFIIDGGSGEVVAKSVKPFDAHITEKAIEKRPLALNKRKGHVQLRKNGIRLNDILLREDGSAVLLGEQYGLLTQTAITKNLFGRTRTRSTYMYEFNDIIVVSMDEHGQQEWTRKIEKRQYSENDGGFYSSYRMKMIKGALYAVFNNYGKGATANVIGKESGTSSSFSPVLVRLSREGKQKTSILPELNNRNLRLLPQVGINTLDSEMVLLGSGSKRNRFIKLQIFEDPLFTLVK